MVTLDFVGERRPRADEGHIALQDIQELRQLIEAGSAQKAPDGCDAWVGGEFVSGLAFRRLAETVGNAALYIFLVDGGVVVDAHGPELQEVALSAVLPEPLLTKEDRSFGSELDDDRDGKEQGRSE